MTPMIWLTLGGVSLYAHQLLTALGVCLSLAAAWMGLRRAALPGRHFRLFAGLAVFLGFFLAHAGYCLARLDYVLHDLPPGAFFRFWDGNYMLYGGMAGCALAVWLTARAAGRPAPVLLDAVVPGGALMIVFVRVAQGLEGNGYGDYLAEGSPFARFPFAVLDEYYGEWVWALFLLAALYAAALLVFTALKRARFPGERALLFTGLYAAGQIVLESLRRDDFLRWGFVRCSQVISAALVAAALLCYALRARGRFPAAKAACWLLCAALLTLCLLLEFAVEQRVAFLLFLSPGGCYGVMALACLGLAGCIGWMRRLALRAGASRAGTLRGNG